MQGFNMGRYRPYDSDPRKESFNGRTGNHALGKRARKVDEGILIVRFELPFNVWCQDCDAHIGQGVRYNAEKKRVGEYYSTPIFSFRCKKACCQTWMEIQTDPKHTRYVVVSGARQQNKDWDPEENGGFAIQDDGIGGPASLAPKEESDAFASLEKAVTEKELAKSRTERIIQLETAVTAHSSDPYTLNSRLRKQFRREKRQRLENEAKDEDLRMRIGWNSDRPLLSDVSDQRTKEAFAAERDKLHGTVRSLGRHKTIPTIESSSTLASSARSTVLNKNSAKDQHSSHRSDRQKTATPASQPAAAALAARVIANTRQKTDPFRLKR